MARKHRRKKSKRELATRGERRVEHTGTDTPKSQHWQEGGQGGKTVTSAPVRCWEQSAFWVSVVVGILLLACAVAGVSGFCRYVKRDAGNGGRVGTWCAAACNVCFSVGFTDWNAPLLGGWWENLPDTETDVDTTDTYSDTDTEAEETSSMQETGAESGTETETEMDTDMESQTETDTDTDAEDETVLEGPVFVGDRAVELQDMSYADRGALYMENDTGHAPDVEAMLAAAARLTGKSVLIVTSRPMDTYRDGGSMKELAETLAELLRSQGVTAVYVSAPTASDSYLDSYRATMDLLRYETAVMPDVGLVLDLRRSGELTQEGGVLQTDGLFAGGRCAQIRLTVDGEGAYWQESLGVALQLREQMWQIEATLARPTRLRASSGLNEAMDRPAALLTVEIGALGNCYAEAQRSIPLLAQIVASMYSGE